MSILDLFSDAQRAPAECQVEIDNAEITDLYPALVEVSVDTDGWLVHVEDVAEALALAVGDESVAGELYNLADLGMRWQAAVEIARELSGSGAAIRKTSTRKPAQRFNSAKAIAFFDRHGNGTALRRGQAGVRQYVSALLNEVPTSEPESADQ